MICEYFTQCLKTEYSYHFAIYNNDFYRQLWLLLQFYRKDILLSAICFVTAIIPSDKYTSKDVTYISINLIPQQINKLTNFDFFLDEREKSWSLLCPFIISLVWYQRGSFCPKTSKENTNQQSI